MALSNIAGVGGGGVAIPLIMGFFHFKTKPAIAISSFTIFCTTFARFLLNFKEKHPEKVNVCIIDYGLSTIMMPATLAGAQVGALILLTFPSLLIQIFLTLVLAALAVQSTFKAVKITKKENEIARAKKAAGPEADQELGKVAPISGSETARPEKALVEPTEGTQKDENIEEAQFDEEKKE